MSFTPFDSPLARELFGDTELAALFTDAAEIRAMLLFEGALAEVQGDMGLIPGDSAFFIKRAAMEVQVDAAALAPGYAAAGVPVPALVEAFRKAMDAPDHAAWAHFGPTSQDVIDTGLVLRLRRALEMLEGRIEGLAGTLGVLAGREAETVMAARTRHQPATPTTFGARAATWRAPLPRHLERLAALQPRLLVVSLAGAAGTSAALGPRAAEVEEKLAAALGLGVAEHPWNATRDGIAELSHWLALVAGACGKIATDVLQMVQMQPAGIRLGAAGGSSTMPHKQNPVAAESIVALTRHVVQLSGGLGQALLQEGDRDGATWAQEWLTLPQMICATGAALRLTAGMVEGLQVDAAALRAELDATRGLVFAEAVTFALSAHMPRPEAAAQVKAACRTAIDEGRELRDVLEADPPAPLDWNTLFDPLAQSGRAVELARRAAT
ncbi:class-II fumarase/aspartase family protein [Pontivivens ytuae]|uniref:Adenylosuccinate lyase family protein n=1 Tax=Pontivivens ytuae TaxID=2789856 RepID=A0A7S9LPV7_9RHOB|nr:adenylosuccinate lyase family protein [Pontivivens ytuae]QPH53053.1 adenylosuccinate lyase family protein [Pontivivens ytuae]